MKFKTRILALLLVLVMLLPMVVACGESTVENNPAADKTPQAGELVEIPEEITKTDAKALLLELLKSSKQDVSMADVSIKFKGDITVSFLDPSISYNTNEYPHLDENGYIDIEGYSLFEMLESILNDNFATVGDLDAGLKQVLFDMLLGAEGQDGLEAIMGEAFNSITFEGISADYGSSDNYITALLVSRMVLIASVMKEYGTHGQDIPNECMEYIKFNVSYTMEVVEEVLCECDDSGDVFEEILKEVFEGGYLNYLKGGCINGYNDTNYDSYDALADAISNIYLFIMDNGDAYEDGDYTLYYDAIKNELEALVNIGMATFIVQDDLYTTSLGEVFVTPVVQALDEYLASDEGPLMQGDFAKTFVAIVTASVASVTAIEMFIDLQLEDAFSEIEYAYFDLKTEKWYDVNGDEITNEFMIVSESPLGYAAYVGDSPDYYDYVVGSANVYAVYPITFDEIYVSVDTFSEMAKKTFAIYTNALDNVEVTEQNAMLLASMGLVYAFSLPQQDEDFGRCIDAEFAVKYIRALTGMMNTDATVNGFAEILALFIDDEEEIEEAVEYLLLNNITGEETVDDLNEQLLYKVAYILAQMDTDEAFSRFDYDGFYWELGLHIYTKYLNNEDGNVYDGVTVYIAAGLLYAYANEKLGIDFDFDSVLDYYFDGYYSGDSDNSTYTDTDEPLVYYEDLIAMALMLQNEGDLDSLFAYDYPFDYVEHNLTSIVITAVLQSRAEYDEDSSIYEYEMQVIRALLDDIFTNNAPVADRFVIVAETLLVALNTQRTLNADLEDAIRSYTTDYLAYKYENVDYNGEDYDIDFALEQFVNSLFDELHPSIGYTALDYIIYLAIGDADPEYNKALATAITDAIMGVDVTDPAAMGELLKALDTIIGVPGLGNIADAFLAILPNDGDNAIELMLDAAILEIFGESDLDYTVLTDVILALMNGDQVALAAAIETAIVEMSGDPINDIKGDYITIGYLRALSGEKIGVDGYANAFTILYLISDMGDDSYLATIPAVLYLNYDEFILYFEFVHDPAYVNVRAWADKYINEFIADANGVNVVEAAVDFLVAVGYYDEEEIPAEDDPAYYEKLTTVYVAEQILRNDDWAEAVVAVMFDNTKLGEYAETFLEMADAYSEAGNQTLAVALYVLQTVAHLERDDFYDIDWEEVLEYAPELVYGMTGEKLNITNYTALAEMLKKAYDKEVVIDLAVECVPYENATATVYVFTVTGSIANKAVNGEFEAIITFMVPKN